MEKIVIYSTAAEIAEALKMVLKEYWIDSPKPPKPVFETEKMTVSQGALYIQTSYQTLCKWINEGRIPVHGIGRKRFLLKTELVEAYKNLS